MSDNFVRVGLDSVQVGHLRHFINLARQLPNQWDLMKGKGYGQEDFGGYRFQLAYMAYALALTHRHRLPAAPGVFKPVFELLMEKILLPEVWMYWRDVSRGGIFIRTKEPLPVGTQLRFEFQLQDASSLIAGEGTVVWIREHDPARTGVAPGRNRSTTTSTGRWSKVGFSASPASPIACSRSAISRPSSDSACTTWSTAATWPTR